MIEPVVMRSSVVELEEVEEAELTIEAGGGNDGELLLVCEGEDDVEEEVTGAADVGGRDDGGDDDGGCEGGLVISTGVY